MSKALSVAGCAMLVVAAKPRRNLDHYRLAEQDWYQKRLAARTITM